MSFIIPSPEPISLIFGWGFGIHFGMAWIGSYLDARTITVFMSFLMVFFGGAGLLLAFTKVPYRSLRDWSIAVGVVGAGILLLTLRGTVTDFLAIVVANGMIHTAIATTHIVNRRHFDSPVEVVDWAVLLPPALLVVLFALREPLQLDLAQRTIVFATSGLLILGIILLRFPRQGRNSFGGLFVQGAILFMVLATFVRGYWATTPAGGSDIFTADILNNLTLIAFSFGLLVYVVGITAMGWERTMLEEQELARENHKLVVLRAEGEARRARELESAFEELRETQERLVEAEKLASIGVLAAGIAHEINNPVGFLTSNTTTLATYMEKLGPLLQSLQTGAPSEQLQQVIAAERLDLGFLVEDIGEILKSNTEGLKRITTVVRGLKTFTKWDPDDLHGATDLNEVVETALMKVSVEVFTAAEVEFKPGEIPHARIGRRELDEVLIQILRNAAQAIVADPGMEEGKIVVSTYREEQYVCCQISDNGVGIPSEDKARIFEPFFTTREVGSGMGLGLTIVYNTVVARYQGKITVENLLPRGTRFTIMLPGS